MTKVLTFLGSLIDMVNMLWDISPIVFILCLIVLVVGVFLLISEIHEFSVNPGLHPKNHRKEADDCANSFSWFNKLG